MKDRDTLLIEMAKLLIGIAIYGAGYGSDCTQLNDLRKAIDDAEKDYNEKAKGITNERPA